MSDTIQYTKEILFFKQSEGRSTAEEKELVQELIANSEQAAAELDLVKQLITLDTKIKAIQDCDTERGFAMTQKKAKMKKPKVRLLNTLIRVAAVLTLPLLLSTFALLYINRTQQQSLNNISMIEVVSAPGMVSCFNLPDSSRVWLNSGSTLRYPAVFHSAVREVKLVGEGYFEVKSDLQHPFYVIVQNGIKVMAHGTHFNVNAYDGANVEAVLAKGKINVYTSDQSVHQLSPGERALYNKENGDIQIEKINIYEKTAWKDGKIIFRNASLDEVFKRLEKRYNIDIVLHDKSHLSVNYRCRVTFTNETIQQIFSYLEVAAPIKWKISESALQDDSTLFKQRVDVWLNDK